MTSWRTTGCTSKFPAHFPQSRAELWKNRAIICPIKSRGGPGVPPLRTPSASLHSAPSPKREGCGRVRTPAPTRIQGRSRSPRRGRSQTGQPIMGKFPGYGGRGTPQGGFSCPCGAIYLLAPYRVFLTMPVPELSPHPSGLTASHLPPRGKA